MFAGESTAGRGVRLPPWNWAFRSGDNAPLARVDCAESRFREHEETGESSDQQAVDSDDDGWLGETLFLCHGEQQEAGCSGEACRHESGEAAAEHLTVEYVHQLVAALQEARQHLDSLAEFVRVNNGDPLTRSTSRHSEISVRETPLGSGAPWEIMPGELKFSGKATGRASSRSMCTQTENAGYCGPSKRTTLQRKRRIGRTLRNDEEETRKRKDHENRRRHLNRDAFKRHGERTGPMIERWLNEAWAALGKRSRQRMSFIGRHYRNLYRRHVRLRRHYCQHRRRFRHVQRQHQLLLESIGNRVDDLAFDWAQRVRHLLAATGPDDNGRDERDARGATFRRNRLEGRNVSWRQWHVVLSLKLDWVRSSHGTVVDHLLRLVQST